MLLSDLNIVLSGKCLLRSIIATSDTPGQATVRWTDLKGIPAAREVTHLGHRRQTHLSSSTSSSLVMHPQPSQTLRT